MKEHHTAYPPFTHFSEFLRDQSHIRNNPSFQYESMSIENDSMQIPSVVVKKTCDVPREIQNSTPSNDDNSVIRKCPLHNLDHPLNKCRTFRSKTIQERIKFLMGKNICFRCCASTTHYNVKLIRYQFGCTRCAFRLLKSLQWYSGRKSWKSGKKIVITIYM
jgi:hypothetical protein